MFENKIIRGVHASRYIASWNSNGGTLGHEPGGRFDFCEWLESLGLEADEVRYIYNMATCGKLELESSAKKFIQTLRD